MPDKLKSYIATRDRKLQAAGYWCENQFTKHFEDLIRHKTLRVGGRATCGNHLDMTWRIYTLWNEIVKKANTLGYKIAVKVIKQDCRWVTTAGGYWHENEYTLEAAP